MISKKNFLKRINTCCLLCFLLLANGTSIFAQGDLLVSPTRVLFDGKKTINNISLINTGNDTLLYNISLIEYRITENGQYERITEPDTLQRFASNYLRYFPRRVKLAPKEAQLIKIQLIKRNQIKEGEYRSHLYFRAVKKPTTLGNSTEVKENATLSFKLTPVYGITIPILIQKGKTITKVAKMSTSFKMSNSVPKLKLIIEIKGNMSISGDIIVDYVSPTGKTSNVGFLKSFYTYLPIGKRQILLNLNNTKHIDYTKGKLIIKYKTATDINTVLLAEKEIQLNPLN